MKVGTDAVLIGAWATAETPRNILDIGTGTGVIALMMAQKFTESTIDAIDIDKSAYLQAKENFGISPWQNRLFVHEIPLQLFFPGKKYDLIISNPPYFVNSSKAPEEARTKARHNDELPYHELLSGVLRLLAPGGHFFLILPIKEAEQFIELASAEGLKLNRLMRVRTKPEKAQEKRIMMQFSFNGKAFNEETLVIENETPLSYTQEYKLLTREFYKNF